MGLPQNSFKLMMTLEPPTTPQSGQASLEVHVKPQTQRRDADEYDSGACSSLINHGPLASFSFSVVVLTL